MTRWGLVALGAVLLWAPGCACGGGGAEPPRRLVARQELTNASPTAALGEDCTAGGRNACRTGVCLHHGAGVHRGYTCSRLCTTDADCPADGWSCGEILPGDSNRFCIPPRAWTARAVSVRPASAASPVRAAAPATATTSLDGGLSP